MFRTMADSAPVFMWISGPDKLCTFFNEGWLRFTGRTMQQEIGNGWTEGVHPGDLERCLTIYRTSFDKREPYEMDYRLLRHDGEYRWILDRGVPFHRGDGVFTGYIGACIDITERREAQIRLVQKDAELERLNQELEQRVKERTAELVAANRELERFAATVSHDLRGPLRSIINTSNTLLLDHTDRLDEEGAKLLHRQAEAAARMNGLIDALRELSRLGMGQLDRVEFDLSRLAQEVADELSSREWACPVVFDVMPGLRAYADPRHLRAALQNFIENSLKFSCYSATEEVRVEVGAIASPEGTAYYVRDNGPGFQMAQAREIFQPFGSRPFYIPGTGIGLVSAERIIARHGGRVWAESQPGEGATFYFTVG